METILAIAIFSFVTSITPGPNNIMLMTSGVNHGVKRSLPHALGIAVGFPLMLAVVGLGFGAVFLAYPFVHLGIKILGSAYLLYLAWKIAIAASPHANEDLKKPLTFIQALLFQWVNPKAWVMAVGAIAIFTTSENLKIQMLNIIASFLTIGTLCMFVWLLFGVVLQRVLQTSTQLRYFNITMAVLLVASIVPMVLVEITNFSGA